MRARAEAIALLRMAVYVHAWAVRRREAAEAVFEAARAEAAEMPPEWRVDDPLRPWSGNWLPYTWRALGALAEASAAEREWFDRTADQAVACARVLDEAPAVREDEIPF